LKWESTQPDEILFRRAAFAADHGKYDVARLTLQTFVNTYPDSDLVPAPRQEINDLCQKQKLADPTTTCASPEWSGMRFFPALPQ